MPWSWSCSASARIAVRATPSRGGLAANPDSDECVLDERAHRICGDGTSLHPVRLARFIDRALDDAEILAGPGAADRKDLVRRSCPNLLVGAIADQRRRFTRGFRRSVERHLPFSLAAIRRLRRRAERCFTGAASRLQARRGAASLLDLAAAEGL